MLSLHVGGLEDITDGFRRPIDRVVITMVRLNRGTPKLDSPL